SPLRGPPRRRSADGMSRSDRQGRRRRDACGGAALACLASALLYGCAPVAPMRGGPVAGAITVFGHPGGGVSGRSGALDRLGPGVIPTLDGFQDAASVLVTHRFTGGNEKTVLRSLEQSLPADLIVNTGDVVENGSRGRQWEAFAARHAALRSRSPFIAAVGNHERTYPSGAPGNCG